MILGLEEDLSSTLNWSRVNHMAASPGKVRVMFLGMRVQLKLTLEINDVAIPDMGKGKLLGVTIASKLKFDDHIEALFQTTNRNVSLFHVWLIT